MTEPIYWHWVTTAPSTLTPAWQDPPGWRLHAVQAPAHAKFSEIRSVRAACGTLGAHGWSLDLFIKKRCAKCLRKTGLACEKCGGKGSTGKTSLGTWSTCLPCLGTGEKPGSFDRHGNAL